MDRKSDLCLWGPLAIAKPTTPTCAPGDGTVIQSRRCGWIQERNKAPQSEKKCTPYHFVIGRVDGIANGWQPHHIAEDVSHQGNQQMPCSKVKKRCVPAKDGGVRKPKTRDESSNSVIALLMRHRLPVMVQMSKTEKKWTQKHDFELRIACTQ